ncbi:MAG: NAD(P)-dependent oxidoreductase, partial [Deinococcota bacterium]|nr:NAD(P)-dependent oxidoreductase [Deinococcota bacterium]
MKVLVTGGSGALGRWVIRELAGHGYEVVNADLRPPGSAKDLAHYRETDLTDVGQVAGALYGCEAVVHLGAIPSPGRHPDEVVFATNTRATFAVLQAAALLGVGKAVVASSTAALGTAFALHPFPPHYVPIDEAHPLLPQDPYALSKEVTERTGEAFHRRTGMSVLAYRFHWITQPGEVAAQAATFRARPELRANELWGYVDVRDAARACRLGIEAKGLGFEVFNITATDSLSEVATAELVERYYP